MVYDPGPLALLQRHLPGKHNQKDHGHGKGGVRQSLADASTTAEVSAAASAEAKRITGRDIQFSMEGSDVQIAREHSDGVLDGLERYPDAGLDRVRTADLGAYPGHEDAWAGTVRGDEIIFNSKYASNPEMYRRTLAESHASGHLVTDNPKGVAVHEFGHVLFHPGAGGFAGQVTAQRAATDAGESVSVHVEHHVSRYATSSGYELGAEAFTDVMLNGSDASALSHQIVEIEVKAAS